MMFDFKNRNNQYSPWGGKQQFMNNGGQPSLQNLRPNQMAYQNANQNASFMQPMYQNEVAPRMQSSFRDRPVASPYDRLEEMRRKRRMKQLQGSFRSRNPFSLRGIY